MRIRSQLVKLLMLSLLATGCVTGPRGVRQSDPHAFVGSTHHSSVVLLSHRNPGTGSGVRIGPEHVLTAMHVVDGYLENGATFDLRVGAQMGEVRLLAHGDKMASHGDWALLQVEPSMLAGCPIIPVHGQATDVAWRPAVGTEVIVAGYGMCLVDDNAFDPAMPAPIVVSEVVPALDPANPDFAWFAEDDGVYELSGMSGGPVMIWNEAASAPELIGIFVGVSKAASTLETPLFNLSLGSDSAIRFVRLPAELGLHLPSIGLQH